MSEENIEAIQEPDDTGPGPYATIRKAASVNDTLYECLMGEVRDLMPHMRAQDIEDALNMVCVSFGKTPLDTLLLIHEFLRNGAQIDLRTKEKGDAR